MVKIMLVDDHQVVSQGVKSYLESFPDMNVVGIVKNGEEAIVRLDQWQPEIVVVDLLMPGGMDGIETTRKIRERNPLTQVVALTASTDEARLMAVLRAGAVGYVRKDSSPEMLLNTIRAAAQGKSLIDPAVAGAVLNDLRRGNIPGNDLTERETGVLRELVRGRTNKEIADALFISEETVKTHIGNILSKLHLAHRTQAVIYAIKRGIISLDEL